jgi:hypothetical protein
MPRIRDQMSAMESGRYCARGIAARRRDEIDGVLERDDPGDRAATGSGSSNARRNNLALLAAGWCQWHDLCVQVDRGNLQWLLRKVGFIFGGQIQQSSLDERVGLLGQEATMRGTFFQKFTIHYTLPWRRPNKPNRGPNGLAFQVIRRASPNRRGRTSPRSRFHATTAGPV